MSVCPAQLTIFVCSHQLVHLLIGPRSQNLNEALLICTNALQERRNMLGRAEWEALAMRGPWSSLGCDTSCSHGFFGSAFKHHLEDAIQRLKAWFLVPPVQQLS